MEFELRFVIHLFIQISPQFIPFPRSHGYLNSIGKNDIPAVTLPEPLDGRKADFKAREVELLPHLYHLSG